MWHEIICKSCGKHLGNYNVKNGLVALNFDIRCTITPQKPNIFNKMLLEKIIVYCKCGGTEELIRKIG